MIMGIMNMKQVNKNIKDFDGNESYLTPKDKPILDYINDNILIKVGVSDIEGVGLIAIKDIKKGKNLQVSPNWERVYRVSKDYLQKELHPNVYKVLCDRGGHGDVVDIELTPSMTYHYCLYVNHSDEPNAAYNGYGEMVLIKDVKEGEEVTVNYDDIEWGGEDNG